jgi:hypothetical protein
MKKYLLVSISCLLIILSCAKAPEEEHWRYDFYVPDKNGLHIAVCHCNQEFDYVKYRGTNVTGYSTGRSVYVIGKRYNGRVYCNLHDLGHEAGHAVARFNKDFIDPHDYPMIARIEGDY